MRKCFAIGLLLLLLFNLVGYRVLFSFLENHVQEEMEAMLDKEQPNTAGLLEIKVPLSLPYITNTASFERYNGCIEVKGLCYSYVARMITGDTLILVCITNSEQNRLRNAKNECAGVVVFQNKSIPKTNSAVLLLGLWRAAYNQELAYFYFLQSKVITALNRVSNDNTTCDAVVALPEQPPETVKHYSNC